MSDVEEEFRRITAGLTDIDWERAAQRPEPDWAGFAKEEIDSPPAVGGAPIHPSHLPQSFEQARADDPGGAAVRHCQRCCVRIDTGFGSVTRKAVAECAGKRTIVIDDRGQLRWMPVPEMNRGE